MKKIVLFAAALVAVTTVSAQTGEITSNRGENWLSQDGDWGLTFDATPMLNYVGNLFNGNTNNGGLGFNNMFPSTSTSGSQVVIGGKKLIDANTAYRGRVRIGFGSDKQTVLVDQNPGPADATVEDVAKTGFFALNLGAGIEKRVGSTRVVGVYGAEFNVGLGSEKTTYEYGNALNADNPSNTPQFGQATGLTESKAGSRFSLGLMAFAGIEWFAAPKISLSGEYMWGIGLSSRGYGETTSEAFVDNAIVTTTTEGGIKENSFSLDTGISGAMIGINFYFQ